MEDRGHLLELLEKLEEGTLHLERGQGDDRAPLVHRLFQSAHNLKSGLAMAGLPRASRLLHILEDGLDGMRRGRLAWSAAWGDALLQAVDRVKVCLDEGNDEEMDLSFDAPGAPEAGPAALDAPTAAAAARAAAAGHRLYRIEKLFSPGLDRSDFEGHLIYDDIADHGTLVSVTPGWEDYSRSEAETVVRFLFTSPRTHEQLSQLFFDPLIELPVDPGARGSLSTDGQFRILVIEDDRITSVVVVKALKDVAEVEAAFDGAEGVRLFARAADEGRPFDVVVCDLEMPGTDGHKALEQIRMDEESRGIYGLDRCLIFMNTANHDLANVQRSFRLQADAYFIKPLSVTQIRKRLEQSGPWLETRRRGT